MVGFGGRGGVGGGVVVVEVCRCEGLCGGCWCGHFFWRGRSGDLVVRGDEWRGVIGVPQGSDDDCLRIGPLGFRVAKDLIRSMEKLPE